MALVVLAGCVPEAESPSSQLPTPGESSDRLLVVIHGGGDDPGVWAEPAIRELSGRLPEPERWEAVALDWEEVAAQRTSAARRGLELGDELGRAILEDASRWEHVLIVAHSVGAFVAQGAVDALTAESGRPTMHVVFLDPFCMRRVTDRSWGNEHFGQGADLAESYYATDDGAPSTNAPLEHADNVDVTDERPETYDPERAHWWPIDAWLQRTEQDPSLLAPDLLAP